MKDKIIGWTKKKRNIQILGVLFTLTPLLIFGDDLYYLIFNAETVIGHYRPTTFSEAADLLAALTYSFLISYTVVVTLLFVWVYGSFSKLAIAVFEKLGWFDDGAEG